MEAEGSGSLGGVFLVLIFPPLRLPSLRPVGPLDHPDLTDDWVETESGRDETGQLRLRRRPHDSCSLSRHPEPM